MIEQKGSENNNKTASRSVKREQDIEASRLQTETGLAPVPPLGVVAVCVISFCLFLHIVRSKVVGFSWFECFEKATTAFSFLFFFFLVDFDNGVCRLSLPPPSKHRKPNLNSNHHRTHTKPSSR